MPPGLRRVFAGRRPRVVMCSNEISTCRSVPWLYFSHGTSVGIFMCDRRTISAVYVSRFLDLSVDVSFLIIFVISFAFLSIVWVE